jgi:hypothetical protein
MDKQESLFHYIALYFIIFHIICTLSYRHTHSFASIFFYLTIDFGGHVISVQKEISHFYFCLPLYWVCSNLFPCLLLRDMEVSVEDY